MKNNQNLIKDLNELLKSAKVSYKAMKNDRLSNSFKKIASIDQYEKMPLTTKEDFYDYDLSKKFSYIKRSRLDENGKEPILPLTQDDYWRYVESEVGRFKAMGVKKTDRISVVNFTINETIPIVNSLMKLGATYVVTEGEVNLICDDLIKKEVNVIFTYHRMLEKIIEHLESRSLKLSLKLVIVTAEPIDDKDLLRKRVKKILGAKLIDTIGTREIGGYAYECPEKSYYHFLDSLYIETVDQETKQPTSKEGELLITPLWRKDLPLIRFATQDLIQLKPKTCSCHAKNNLVFEKVLGRINENVKIGYSMVDLREVYFETKRLINYQYPLLDKLLLRVLPEINFSLLLTNEKETDVLVIFAKRNEFNQYLRRKRIITEKLANKFNIGAEIVLLSATDFSKLANNKYLDIRYMKKNKVPKYLLKILNQ